jgi:ParB-like chromosome segregation protein Spo0J
VEERSAVVELDAIDKGYASLRLPRPGVLAALRSSIERHGILQPLLTNERGARLVLLDGYKRIEVLSERGEGRAPVRVLRLEPAQALGAILTFNSPHRGLCELEEAGVVRALCRDLGLRQTEVATLLGRHKTWVCRRLRLAEELSPAIQDDVRLGLVSVTAAREVARLPRGNQDAVAQSIREHGLGVREAEALVSLISDCADEEARRAVLDDPKRFLQPAEREPRRAPARDPRLSGTGNDLRRLLLRFEGSAARLDEGLRALTPESLAAEERPLLGRFARRSLERAHDLLDGLALLARHAEGGHE